MEAAAQLGKEWADKLRPEQRAAASHDGGNARLLAGPGTGKTLTLRARVAFLVLEKGVEPSEITALTFTRAAAAELRKRVDKALEGKVAGRPRITTLHSFALRLLLRNSTLVDALPQPLRIADDWEERNIVQEDLKVMVGGDIKEIQGHLRALSADWDTLRADETQPNALRADANFVGAWQEHRELFGYTLRSELVYQAKRALEQRDDLKFDGELRHLLVDEYQDLNRCDLTVIARLAEMGATVFAAGDDDQSIYGFRHANPEGIRRFDRDYAPSTDRPLGTCMRCDRAVMELARFVADLDVKRLKKPWEPREDAGEGEVSLLRCVSGDDEAAGIASLCKYLTTDAKLRPDDILILIRSDQNGAFSVPLTAQMEAAGVPFNVNVGSASPLDSASGRTVLSMARLIVDAGDSLAWRTLLQVRKNGVGAKMMSTVIERAKRDGTRFGTALRAVAGEVGGALGKELAMLDGLLAAGKAVVGRADEEKTAEQVQAVLAAFGGILQAAGVLGAEEALDYMSRLAGDADVASFKEVLSVVSMAGITPDQEMAAGAVNMMTMHKAKGLDARAVIVMACEDEYLPGRQQSVDGEADERRLLYVSLTRARERLYVTYAQRRTGQQQHTGRDSGKQRRTLTRYLRNAPIHPEDAATFFSGLGG